MSTTIAGLHVVEHETTIPPSGCWVLRGHLAGGTPPAVGSRATVTLADLSLVGTVEHTGEDSPDQPTITVRGGIGWLRPLTAASFQSPGGVKLSTVLRALAAISGEPLELPAEAIVGPAYSWPASSPLERLCCADVLAALVRRGALSTWRVAPGGATRFDPWPALKAADPGCRVLSRALAVGLRRVALDRAAHLLPGATLEGATIRRVIFHEDADDLRAEVYS